MLHLARARCLHCWKFIQSLSRQVACKLTLWTSVVKQVMCNSTGISAPANSLDVEPAEDAALRIYVYSQTCDVSHTTRQTICLSHKHRTRLAAWRRCAIILRPLRRATAWQYRYRGLFNTYYNVKNKQQNVNLEFPTLYTIFTKKMPRRITLHVYVDTSIFQCWRNWCVSESGLNVKIL